MLHGPTAARWGAQPRFLQSMRRWRWCSDAVPELMLRLGAGWHMEHPVVERAALARAFWQWAGTLESTAALEPLDRVDHAHFQAGMWLAQLLWQRPIRWPGAERADEVGLCTGAALTLLAAWRSALGAPPLDLAMPAPDSARWASYVENVVDDPLVAVAFLDGFTGREPVWQFPTVAAERPPMRQALEERRRHAA